jgi:hypothetical protein
VVEATNAHLFYLLIVARVKRGEPAPPADCLGMIGVASFACRKDRPDRVQLSVLAEQMLVAQFSGIEIPDAHTYQPSEGTGDTASS